MHRLARLPRPAPGRRRRDRVPARPVPDRRLPGALGRPDAAHAARRVDVLDRRRGRRAAAAGRGTSSRRCRRETVTTDIHCVTKWSKLDTVWDGVSVDTLLDGVEHRGRATCSRSATAATRRTCRSRTCTDGKAWVAYAYDGEPLDPEHGGPARLLVPHLYFWKSAKWVRGLELRERGRARLLGVATATTCYGDPWREQRYCGRLTWLRRRGGRGRRRDADACARSCSTCPAGPGTAPGQHVDVRLTAEDGYQRRAQLLDRVGAGGRAGRAHRRAARRRRGLAVPGRRAAAGRRARAARPDRRLLRLGRATSGPLLLVGGGSGDRAADGDARAPRARSAIATCRRGCWSRRGRSTT